MVANCTQAKLNPTGAVGATRISFPGYQKIADSALNGESTLSVTVASTDLDIIVYVFNSTTSQIRLRLNNDTGSNYGYQYLENASGAVTAGRGTNSYMWASLAASNKTLSIIQILAPSGFNRAVHMTQVSWSSGTTMADCAAVPHVWNSTANLSTLDFYPSTGTFASGTRITVYARRS